MAAELFFANGAHFTVAMDATKLLEVLTNAKTAPSANHAVGWAPLETDNGSVFVNPTQVAYVRSVSAS